jgi:pyruvate dehydrogenase E2 component (dihydrolipoamide acetyltransferase)
LLIIIRLKVQTNLEQEKKLNQPKKKKKKKKLLLTKSSDGQRILASPLAKKIANDKGIQLTQVKVQVKMDVSLRAMSNFTPAPAVSSPANYSSTS